MRKAKCNKNSLEKNMEAVKDKPLSTWPVDTTVVKCHKVQMVFHTSNTHKNMLMHRFQQIKICITPKVKFPINACLFCIAFCTEGSL